MRAGRKPKPTHLKLLAGKPGHRPLPEGEPQPDAVDETMQPPTWLDGSGRAVWDVEFPKLARNRMITEVDIPAFARWCQAYADLVEARDYVSKQGAVLIAPSGFPIQNPYKTAYNKASEQMSKLETEFGMTPSSRSRVSSATPKKKANRFLELVDGSSKTKRRA